MKKIIFTLVALGIITSQGCITIPSPEEVQKNAYNGYSEVVELNSIPKDQIFELSKIWIAKSFNSANNVIQYADKNTGIIIGKGNFSLKCPDKVKGMNCLAYTSTKAEFTLKIEIKDGKSRLTFSDVHQAVNNYPFYDNISKPIIDSQIKGIVKNYHLDIVNQKNDSNW